MVAEPSGVVRSTVGALHPSAGPTPLGRFVPSDLDILRLILRGSSVVDWVQLHFESVEEIIAFIRVNGFDPDDPADRQRLEDLRKRAFDYLRDHLKYRRIPERVLTGDTIALLNFASGKGRRAYRFYACMALKVMHILHYTEAHELLSMLPISNAELAVLLRGKVERVVRGLVERGFGLVDFSGNAKTAESVVTKLLAKKETQSAQVFDKLRFRFVLKRIEDVPILILALTRELLPFNYVVPNQSDNSLVDLDRMLIRAGNLMVIRMNESQTAELNEPGDSLASEQTNEFSGPSYRVAHFITEVPIRIDHVIPFSGPRLSGLGPVVFGTVEFQVVDEATARTNESGENRHSLYKARQIARVRERLERGKRNKR